jgi:thioesterase domain-containing protein/acyl carrier protein
MMEEPGCTEEDTLLAVTTLSFDIAALELYLPLVVGGTVAIATRDTAADGRLLRARLERGDITMLQATPATWRMLIDAGWRGTPGLRALIGGEALPPDLVQPLIERTGSLWNMYGPTETTVWSSVQRVASAPALISIGRPIANTRFRVVDAHLRTVPIGIAGELVITGDGLARGYRNRPELTAERFIEEPGDDGALGSRAYRTGDLVRYTRAGELVHLGRSDSQVKIRGFRVELGEVEAALAAQDSVRRAAVVAHRAGTAAARLVAYIVVGEGAVPTPRDLRLQLRTMLPDYMVPRQFVIIPELPLTPNGKIDRNRLPEPDHDAESRRDEVAVPMSPMEATVAAAFCDVLGLTEVGVDDDFFELGGQSILALRLISQLGDEFGVELPLQVLFDASTVGALSRRLDTLVSTTPELRTVVLEGTDLEEKLRSVWSTAVGSQPPDDDRPGAPLTDSQIVRLLARVRQEFGVAAEGLSALEFRSDPTISGLARFLRDALDPPTALVVPLQPHGTEAPLFLIHAGGGYVFFYRALAARLGPDQPVHAIRAATRRDGHRHRFDRTVSIESLASRYIEEIKAVQPEGPYRLGGSCFGGVVAFEMAQQLIARGESVGAPVLLFDSYVGKVGEDWREYASRTFSSVAERLGAEPGSGPRALARALAVSAVKQPVEVLKLAPLTARSLLRRGLGVLRVVRIRQWVRDNMPQQEARSSEQDQLDTMHDFLNVSIELVSRYEPRQYPGGAVLLKASVGPDPEPLWKPWVAEGLKVHVMPGEHLDMMEEPWVEQTARRVRQALDA